MSKKIMHFQNGEKIIRAGETEKRMYIILDGCVRIAISEGEETLVLAILYKGSFFGEISLLTDIPRTASATADGDVTVTYIDNLTQLRDFLVKNPSFSAKMVHTLAQRLARTDEILRAEMKEVNRIKNLKGISGLNSHKG